MSFPTPFKLFLENEDGAVTVDWVVLAAAVVGIAIAVLSTVSTGVEDLSTDISGQLSRQSITTAFK